MLSIFVVFSTLKILGYLVWPWYIVCIPLYYLIFEIVVGLLLFVWTHKTFKNIYKEKRKELPDLSPLISDLKEKGKKND